MLPDSENSPSRAGEGDVDCAVSCLVGRQLRGPVAHVLPRDGPVLGTAVPEAAIHEHRNSLAAEADVRTSRSIGAGDGYVLAEAVTHPMELRAERLFGAGIRLAVGAHHGGDGAARRMGVRGRHRCQLGSLRNQDVRAIPLVVPGTGHCPASKATDWRSPQRVELALVPVDV
jgi:hypothetical protein